MTSTSRLSISPRATEMAAASTARLAADPLGGLNRRRSGSQVGRLEAGSTSPASPRDSRRRTPFPRWSASAQSARVRAGPRRAFARHPDMLRALSASPSGSRAVGAATTFTGDASRACRRESPAAADSPSGRTRRCPAHYIEQPGDDRRHPRRSALGNCPQRMQTPGPKPRSSRSGSG